MPYVDPFPSNKLFILLRNNGNCSRNQKGLNWQNFRNSDPNSQEELFRMSAATYCITKVIYVTLGKSCLRSSQVDILWSIKPVLPIFLINVPYLLTSRQSQLSLLTTVLTEYLCKFPSHLIFFHSVAVSSHFCLWKHRQRLVDAQWHQYKRRTVFSSCLKSVRYSLTKCEQIV